ncbi:hypothetical protein JTB14_029831 [Gonioctena quinquepunctata]|nr:hypothetical protein JTB14_029831 [Gonioctena quinquepunctata]
MGKPVEAMDGCLSELTSLVKELRIEIAEMKASLNFFNELLESERVRNQVLSEMVGELRAENVDHKRDVSYMTSYVDSIKYQKIKNNLGIAGLCKNGNEDLNSIKLNVLSVLKTIDNSVQAEDINEVKLSKTKNDQRPLVLVTINDLNIKNGIFKSKIATGQLSGQKCKVNGVDKIYVNEQLTFLTLNILHEANNLKKVGYKFVWSRNGIVYARIKEGENAIKINSIYHCRELLLATK